MGCGNPEADRALRVAASNGNIEAAKQAIEDGADVNARDLYLYYLVPALYRLRKAQNYPFHTLDCRCQMMIFKYSGKYNSKAMDSALNNLTSIIMKK